MLNVMYVECVLKYLNGLSVTKPGKCRLLRKKMVN